MSTASSSSSSSQHQHQSETTDRPRKISSSSSAVDGDATILQQHSPQGRSAATTTSADYSGSGTTTLEQEAEEVLAPATANNAALPRPVPSIQAGSGSQNSCLQETAGEAAALASISSDSPSSEQQQQRTGPAGGGAQYSPPVLLVDGQHLRSTPKISFTASSTDRSGPSSIAATSAGVSSSASAPGITPSAHIPTPSRLRNTYSRNSTGSSNPGGSEEEEEEGRGRETPSAQGGRAELDSSAHTPAASEQSDEDETDELEFLTPTGDILAPQGNPFSLPAAAAAIVAPTASGSSSSTPSTPAMMRSVIPITADRAEQAHLGLLLSHEISSRSQQASVAALSTSSNAMSPTSVPTHHRPNLGSTSGAYSDHTYGYSQQPHPVRADSTRTTVSLAATEISSSEASAETDPDSSSLLSSSHHNHAPYSIHQRHHHLSNGGGAGRASNSGASSLGRSGSCASTTPTSPGVGEHRELHQPSALETEEDSKRRMRTAGIVQAPQDTGELRRESCPNSTLRDLESHLREAVVPASPGTKAAFLSSSAASSPRSHLLRLGAQGEEAQQRQQQQHQNGTPAKARRGSLPAITMSASQAAAQLRRSAANTTGVSPTSAVADDDDGDPASSGSASASSSSHSHTSPRHYRLQLGSMEWPPSTSSSKRSRRVSSISSFRSPMSPPSPAVAGSGVGTGVAEGRSNVAVDRSADQTDFSSPSGASVASARAVYTASPHYAYAPSPSCTSFHHGNGPNGAIQSPARPPPSVPMRRPQPSQHMVAQPFGRTSSATGNSASATGAGGSDWKHGQRTSMFGRSSITYQAPLKGDGGLPMVTISPKAHTGTFTRSMSASVASGVSAPSSSTEAHRSPLTAVLYGISAPAHAPAHPAGSALGPTPELPTSRSAPGALVTTHPLHRLSLDLDIGSGLGLGLGFSPNARSVTVPSGTTAPTSTAASSLSPAAAISPPSSSSCSRSPSNAGSDCGDSSLGSHATSRLGTGPVAVAASRSVEKLKLRQERQQRKAYQKMRLASKPLPPGPPGSEETGSLGPPLELKRPLSTGAVPSDGYSAVARTTAARSNLTPLDVSSDGRDGTPSRTRQVSGGSAETAVDSDIMERLLDTPLTLLSPPLEDPRAALMAGGARMRRTPSGANRHRRTKSSERPEDYFGLLPKDDVSSAEPSEALESISDVGAGTMLSSSNYRRSYVGFQSVDTGSDCHYPSGSSTMRNSLRRFQSSAAAELPGVTAQAGRDLGLWQAATQQSARRGSTYMVNIPPPAPNAYNRGPMSSLGRRLSAVFDNPPLFSRHRASFSSASGKRSYADSSAAPSEPGSPTIRWINPTPDEGADDLPPALEPGPSAESQPPPSAPPANRSRPGSSIGFFRNTLRFDRKPSGSDGPKMLKGEAQLLSRQKVASSTTKDVGSSKIPVSSSKEANGSRSNDSEPRSSGSGSPTKRLRKPRPGGAAAGATAATSSNSAKGSAVSESAVAVAKTPIAKQSLQRGRSGKAGTSTAHSRSPSVDVLNMASSSVESHPAGSQGGLGHMPPRSSLALAELEASIEAAAAKMTSGVGADVWATEVRALFVVREIIQTEWSYAKHLEALIGAVRKTAGPSSSGGAGPNGSSTGTVGAGPRRKSAAGLMTYSAISASSSSSSKPGSSAAHIITMKTLLPPMIVLSRSLAARMEQNPTPAGVGAAFTLLQEQLEANFVSWNRAIGTIMDALRVSEGPKGKGKDRIGLIAPSPVLSGPYQGPYGPTDIRGPPRRSSLDALALTRPSTPVGEGVEDEPEDDTASYPIWASHFESSVDAETPPMQQGARRRSNTLSQSDTPAEAEAKPPTTPLQKGRALLRSNSLLGIHSSGESSTLVSKTAKRRSLAHDDLQALEQAVGQPTEPVRKEPTSAKKDSGKKSQSKSGPTSAGAAKLFEPQDIVIMPTQRVVRYILLLKDLLANIPAGGTAHVRVERALEVVTVVADMCNRVARPLGGADSRGPTSPRSPASSSAVISASSTMEPSVMTPANSPSPRKRSDAGADLSWTAISPVPPSSNVGSGAIGREGGTPSVLSPLTPPSPNTKQTGAAHAAKGSTSKSSQPAQSRRNSFVSTVQGTLKKVAR
ncbi:hypothetical protein V8E36_000807 [Tilletia maclaganii]